MPPNVVANPALPGVSPADAVPSAAQAVQVAIDGALTACAPLTALLASGPDGGPAIFDGEAPAGPTGQPQPLNYLTFGAPAEERRDAYGRAGHAGALELHVWAQGPDKATAAAIHATIIGALEGRALAVAGHTPARVRVALVASLVDPDGRTHHRVLRLAYATRTARTA